MSERENFPEIYIPSSETWYRGTIKIDENGSIVIRAINLERIDPKTLAHLSSESGSDFLLPGFLFVLPLEEDPSSERHEFHETLKENLGRSVKFMFRESTNTNGEVGINKMHVNIYGEDGKQQPTLSVELASYNISTSQK